MPRGALGRASRTLWVVVVPVALACLALRYLVPVTGTGPRGTVAALGHRYVLLSGLGLYFVFSGIARYWYPSPATGARAARRGRELLVAAAMVASAVLVALAFRAYVGRPYRVLSASMLPTLEPDDLVGGRVRPYVSTPPMRGDVVVFRGAAVPGAPGLPETLVKRVIGLPGDRISMRGSVPVVNGWAVPSCDVGEYLHVLPEPGEEGTHGRLRVEFLDDRAYLTVYSMGVPSVTDYAVQPGEVFVLGDSRSNSSDSRSYNKGFGGGVPVGAIDARARWFLVGTRPDGNLDLGRLFQPIDRPRASVRLEGVQPQSIADGIARCLRDRPKDTRPPPP